MTSITSWFQLPPEIRRTIIFHIFNANHPKNSGDATVRPTFDLLQVGEVAALLSQISHAVGRELLSNGCTGASSVFLKRMKSVKSELKDITDAMLASHVANGSPEVVPNQHWEVVNICLDYIQHHAVKALLVWETCQAIQKMANCRIMHLKMLPRREAMKMMLKHRDGFDAAQWAAVLCPSGNGGYVDDTEVWKAKAAAGQMVLYQGE